MKGSEKLWHDFWKLMANTGETQKRAAAKMRREIIFEVSGRQRYLMVAEVLEN